VIYYTVEVYRHNIFIISGKPQLQDIYLGNYNFKAVFSVNLYRFISKQKIVSLLPDLYPVGYI